MKYSHNKSWEKFQEIFSNQESIQSKWESIVKYHQVIKRNDFWKGILKINLESEQDEILAWFQDVITHEPLPESVRGIWVGIAKLWDEENQVECYALYLHGADQYDEEEIEWANAPTYQPDVERRYLALEGLNELDALIVNDNDYSFLDWILPLAYTSIILDNLIRNKVDKKLFKNSVEIGFTVGFDSGDFQVLTPLKLR
jgi:hypothetical protein